jgi:type IV pilus assembly protein PilQ
MKYLLPFFLFITALSFAQINEGMFPTPEMVLEKISESKKGLKEKIKIELAGLTADEIISVLAEAHQLSVSVESQFREPIETRFFDVTVTDVYLFLIQKYDLEVELVRDILIFKRKEKIIIEEVEVQTPIDISYNPRNKFVSLKVKNDSLQRVARAITDQTGENIVLYPEVKGLLVSSYVLNRSLKDVMGFLSEGNNLNITKDSLNVYRIKLKTADDSLNMQLVKNNDNGNDSGSNRFDVLEDDSLSIDKNGFLSISVRDMSLKRIIESAAIKSNVNYFLYDKITDEKRSLKVTGVTFEELLEHLFSGRNESFKNEEGLFLIGKQETAGIRKTKLLKMQNRSIEYVLPSLPQVFSQELEIKEFIELNALIATGNPQVISELEDYLLQIDEIVPLVDIQVIIVQYQNGYDFRTGLEIGVDGNQDRTNQGSLYPSVNGTLNQSGVNKLIDVFNGFGVFNIGKVTDNFYLNLELLETNSIIKINSTPRIASLSGHTANLSIGNTDYYFEQNNQLLTSNVTTDILQSGTWKATEANLNVQIQPFVSTDENITLNIKVEQNSFTGRVAVNAPPGKTTQNFESLVRVKNNEMILLGGLDELNTENSGSGTPWLSRVPVIKWFFSSRRKAKNKSKLHIFIRPTVIY